MNAVNSWGSIRLLLTAHTASGSTLQMCLPAAGVLQLSIQGTQLVFLQLRFIQELWPSVVK